LGAGRDSSLRRRDTESAIEENVLEAEIGMPLQSVHGSKTKTKPRGPWTAAEIARNERANQAQVAHDRARGVSANLEEAVALSRFANRFSEAFRHARRA